MFNGIRRWFARLRGEKAQDDAMLVIGLLPNDSDADIALNNLAEADFASRQISVLTSDPLRTAALTDTPGDWGQLTPAAAVERMRTLGVADADRQTVTTGLSNGGVLIVIRAANASTTAAQEMLADQKATLVRAVKERRGQ